MNTPNKKTDYAGATYVSHSPQNSQTMKGLGNTPDLQQQLMLMAQAEAEARLRLTRMKKEKGTAEEVMIDWPRLEAAMMYSYYEISEKVEEAAMTLKKESMLRNNKALAAESERIKILNLFFDIRNILDIVWKEFRSKRIQIDDKIWVYQDGIAISGAGKMIKIKSSDSTYPAQLYLYKNRFINDTYERYRLGCFAWEKNYNDGYFPYGGKKVRRAIGNLRQLAEEFNKEMREKELAL